jgi:two-component system cell cycle response regulator
LPQSDGMELLQHSKLTQPDVPVLVITALDKVEPAVRAIKSGASDYLVKPVAPEVLAHAITRALTQRMLLRENEELRRHVLLLDAGQRIATTLDRVTMLDAANRAFGTLCTADAVALFAREGDELTLSSLSGVADQDRAEVVTALTEAVRAQTPKVDRGGQAVRLEGVVWPTGLLVPVQENDVLLGAVLLLFMADIPAGSVTTAPYLARHLGLALKNLGKFAEVEDLVYLDDLTHLFNSRYLELVLDKEFKAATKAEKPFSLLFLDLDYFKSINDTHGHVVGSKLLVEVARVLKACVRDNDVLCRWGGDEYVALLRGTDSGGALKVAERIRRAIEQHRFLAREGFGLNMTTCIGVAAYPEHAVDKGTLIDFSDRAMYRGQEGHAEHHLRGLEEPRGLARLTPRARTDAPTA